MDDFELRKLRTESGFIGYLQQEWESEIAWEITQGIPKVDDDYSIEEMAANNFNLSAADSSANYGHHEAGVADEANTTVIAAIEKHCSMAREVAASATIVTCSFILDTTATIDYATFADDAVLATEAYMTTAVAAIVVALH
ncbi:hypothetical protein CRG98_019764 [Punica granatum]|uniref:Uncharacterized protein n=1 Tax=Punica granatum TaxID=22663 RepID=A0A2I0JUE4_PUNGR|nr:hypothetical protein CRG98_019764 [Punica granatum]